TVSVMSRLRNSKAESRMCSMFCSDPVSRLSTQITLCPCPSRYSQRWEPRKPAPPVTTQVLIAADGIGRPDTGSAGVICPICGTWHRPPVQQGGEPPAPPPLGWHVWDANLDRCGGAQREVSQGR